MEEEVLEGGAEGDWYESDLQLAAELGKALLERNRELESQLLQLQQVNQEQNLENEFLTKQLDLLRDSSESRMRVYEELDRNTQELEKANQRLLLDTKADKQRIEKLTCTVDQLENKVEELNKKIDDMKAEEKRMKQKQQKQDTRRAVSLANLREKEHREYLNNLYNGEIHWTYNDKFKNLPLNPYEVEIKSLQEAIKQLKAQQLIEKRKKEDLETEVGLLWDENDSLDKKIKALEDKVYQTCTLEDEVQKLKVSSGKYCKMCGVAIERESEKLSIESEVEHDHPELKTAGKAVRLGGGGSVYGSSESVNKIAPDIKDLSPEDTDTSNSVSILNELENQYQSLFQKYEALMQSKSKRPSSFHEPYSDGETFDEALHRHLAVSHKEVQTLIKLQKTTADASVGDGSTTDQLGSPPAYKSLFRDIFATLKKSRIEESGELAVSTQSSPAVSPADGASAQTAPTMEYSESGET